MFFRCPRGDARTDHVDQFDTFYKSATKFSQRLTADSGLSCDTVRRCRLVGLVGSDIVHIIKLRLDDHSCFDERRPDIQPVERYTVLSAAAPVE